MAVVLSLLELHLLPGVAYDLENGTVGETGRAIK